MQKRLAEIEETLSFDDVLLEPQYSEVGSRSDVDTSVSLGKGFKFNIPIVSSNMKSVTGSKMVKALNKLEALAVVHRFCSLDEQIAIFKEGDPMFTACSVGIQNYDYTNVDSFYEAGCRILMVDVAHAHHKRCGDICKWIAKKYPNALLIAGTVATYEGAMFLKESGVDVVRVGVGSGSLCSTRIEAGSGVPQLSALANMPDDIKIIADGGIKTAGDLTKALCLSDMVMLGSLLAGTDEAPGDLITLDGNPYKEYAGSSTHKSNHIEGIKVLVKPKGSVIPIIKTLMEGVRSGCSYSGAFNLEELKSKSKFVRITQSGLAESHPHSIHMRKI